MREERGLSVATIMVAVIGLAVVCYLVLSVVGGITDVEKALTADDSRIAKCQVQLKNLANGEIESSDLIERCNQRDQVELFCAETPARRQGALQPLCEDLGASK